jgi:hypothetical protein
MPMSKKFKGKTCVYCGKRTSITTGDHVFARQFFLESEGRNLIKVPACLECNNTKSKLEHYLASLLPFGGLHEDASEHLSNLVQPRLDKNLKLKNELREGMAYVVHNNENDPPERRLTLPFDGDQYTELFKYIVKALSWHHWGTFLNEDSFVYTIALTESGEEMFHKYFFSLRPKHRVEVTIGANTIRYLGVQAVDKEILTIWQFHMFNGLVSSSGTKKDLIRSQSMGAITGPAADEMKVKKIFE